MSAGKTCHVCGKMGHVSRDCSQRTCRICGGKGHVASTCAKNPANAVRKCRKCGKSGHFESDCYLFTSQKPTSVCSKCGGPHELYSCTVQNFSYGNDNELSATYNTTHVFVSNLPPKMTKANCEKLLVRYGEVAALQWLEYPAVEHTFAGGGTDATPKAPPTPASNGNSNAREDKATPAPAPAPASAPAMSGDVAVAAVSAGDEAERCVGCFVSFESGSDAESAVEKINGKKVLGRKAEAWPMTTVDQFVVNMASLGRLTAVKRFCMKSKKQTEELMREHEISAVQGRLAAMEKNMRNTSTLDDGSRSKNKHMFGASAEGVGAGVWNGLGVTKTTQCPTLIVPNVPRSVKEEEVKALFQKCTGFFAIRCVRGLYFIDFDGIPNATNAMIKNQNFVFQGHTTPVGLCIDYDKDTRAKRNRQYELSRKPY